VDDARVVDEDVEPPAVRDGRGPVARIGHVEMAVADVELLAPQPRGGLLPRLVEHVPGDDDRALAREPLGVRRALAAGAAGDQDDAIRAVEVKIGPPRPSGQDKLLLP